MATKAKKWTMVSLKNRNSIQSKEKENTWHENKEWYSPIFLAVAWKKKNKEKRIWQLAFMTWK